MAQDFQFSSPSSALLAFEPCYCDSVARTARRVDRSLRPLSARSQVPHDRSNTGRRAQPSRTCIRLVEGTLHLQAAHSRYVGANIPGKLRAFMTYVGGLGAYRRICDRVPDRDYPWFALRDPLHATPARVFPKALSTKRPWLNPCISSMLPCDESSGDRAWSGISRANRLREPRVIARPGKRKGLPSAPLWTPERRRSG